MSIRGLGSVLLAVLALASAGRAGQGLDPNRIVPTDHPVIAYMQKETDDPVARLQQRISAGAISLEFEDNGFGYLRSVLDALDISETSQMLVFSRTSFQRDKIGPDNPRALYFNDAVAVGFVPGGDVLEFAALGARQAVHFYSLSNREVPRGSRPVRLVTGGMTCVQCHDSTPTLGVPGLMVRSVIPDRLGEPIGSAPASIIDHESAIATRWGGWYVTGSLGDMRHLGNAVAESQATPDRLKQQGPMSTLDGVIDTSRYLRPTSDVVALMTLEHQARMSDLMIRIGWDARIAASEGEAVDPAEVEALVRYLLFADEAALSAQVSGSSGFAEAFEARGPVDREQRSLRDFDLQSRMFRYPLSYMIYSETFDALPDPVLHIAYRRLYDVLTDRDQSEIYAHLSGDDRRAILEILVATKTGLPDYFRAALDNPDP